MKKIIFLLSCFTSLLLNAQEDSGLRWYNAADMELTGQPIGKVSNPFQRFPDKMKSLVREKVWELSENPAGLHLNFTTAATNITVSYAVEGVQGFPHMPPTGVSGVDLYLREGKSWKWVKGQYNFGDTISYTFTINPKQDKISKADFMLYLPLYATVKWMKIGIPENTDFKVNKTPYGSALPIVAYGTSITQGACAGRPGTAWTTRLSREMERPVINYGFSGNGRLETEIVKYIASINAEIYVLDCLANFTSGQGLNAEEAKKRLLESVRILKKFNPDTPIILTDHAGYPHGDVLSSQKLLYTELNKVNHEVFDLLKKEGMDKIYNVTKTELDLQMDDFIDGVHPNDMGMYKYARAYSKKIKEINNSY